MLKKHIYFFSRKSNEGGLIMELKILEVSASHAFGMTDIIKKDDYTSVIDEYDFDSTD